MSRKIQPYYWLVALAGLFIGAGLLFFGLRLFGLTFKGGSPIEPHVSNGEHSLFDLWFTGEPLFDLSVDRNVTGIFFGSRANKVSLLDRERRLRWEKSFSSEPLQTKISASGNYVAVGTAGGGIFFSSTDQQTWWEVAKGEPVYRLALSANGQWLAAARGDPEQDTHSLELYRRDGTLQWSVDSGPLVSLYLTGEQEDQGLIFFSWRQDELINTAAINLRGEIQWAHPGDHLAAISRSGSRLAALHGNSLRVYDFLGRLLWEQQLPFAVEAVMFNPQNANVLLYGSGDSEGHNLYYLDALYGIPLWRMRIADGALLSFTADGRYIVTSSWRHFKDDFTRMVVYDESGRELGSWEVAMRVEHLVVTGHRRLIVLGGEDGYIELVDLEARLAKDEQPAYRAEHLYSPVLVGSEGKRVTLFFSSDTEALVPVSRSVGSTDNPVRTAVEELIRGPARDSFLYRTFPKDAEIEVTFEQDSGRLYLDVSPETMALAGAAQSIAALDSLLMTVSQFAAVQEIYITVEGEPVEVFGDGLALDQPLRPFRWRNPVFIPLRSGERYYLVPREARDLEIEKRDLEGLLRGALWSMRNLYFVPGDLYLLGVKKTGNTVDINMNEILRVLFPEHGAEEEHLQAALLLDALLLTALENSTARQINVLVNGESWQPAQGYPPLSRTFFLHRYWINPEN